MDNIARAEVVEAGFGGTIVIDTSAERALNNTSDYWLGTYGCLICVGVSEEQRSARGTLPAMLIKRWKIGLFQDKRNICVLGAHLLVQT